MTRREALETVSVLFGGVVVGSEVFLHGCTPAREKPLNGLLNTDEISMMNQVGETILPKTVTSPGAAEVHVGNFINTMVSDCYSEEEQNIFMAGIPSFKSLCKERFGDPFNDLPEVSKSEIIGLLEDESSGKNAGSSIPHYYTMIKQLVIWGYLSSEEVSTGVLGYVPVPGRYEGCLPFREGDKAVL